MGIGQSFKNIVSILNSKIYSPYILYHLTFYDYNFPFYCCTLYIFMSSSICGSEHKLASLQASEQATVLCGQYWKDVQFVNYS